MGSVEGGFRRERRTCWRVSHELHVGARERGACLRSGFVLYCLQEGYCYVPLRMFTVAAEIDLQASIHRAVCVAARYRGVLAVSRGQPP